MKQTFFFKIKNMSRVNISNLNRIHDHKKFNRIQISFIVLLCLFLGSCNGSVEEITWELKDHAPLLVVDGAVTNTLKNQGIRLTLSNAYFSTNDPEPVHNASVHITEGNISYTFTESTDNIGLYLSNDSFAGVPGKTYNLFINLAEGVNGKKEYTSSSTMPEGLDIDSIQCDIYELPKALVDESNEKKDTTILIVMYFGNEPESPGNYYFAKIFRNNVPLFSSVKSYPFSDDSERNGMYTNFTGVIKNVAPNDTISFYLYSIEKAYYTYINAITKIDQTGDIYSPQGPPANAKGNVDGALGFFVATYISVGKSLAIDMR
jgi:hypothetical protein